MFGHKTHPKRILTLLFVGLLAFILIIQNVKTIDSWIWVRNTISGAYGEAVVGDGEVIYIARKTGFHCYNSTNNSWNNLSPPLNPDSGDTFKTGTALAWDFGDYIYALYGAATSDNRKWFSRYKISTNSWETLASTPENQGEGDAITWVSLDNCIYATVGGEQRETYFFRYDPSTNSWSDGPTDPPDGMGDGASLVWTGDDSLFALRGEFYESSALYNFWHYNLTSDVWTTKTSIPANPYNGGSGGVGDGGSLLYVGFWLASHSNYIYALSGNQYDEVPDNRTYRYTISADSWERLADLPFNIGYYVGSRLGYADGFIYAWQGAPGTWIGDGDDLARYELVLDSVPPEILILSPENKSYSVGDILLTFTRNELTSWIGFSLDGQNNVTISGNTAFSGLSEGSHSIVVYATDMAGNTGASSTRQFTISIPLTNYTLTVNIVGNGDVALDPAGGVYDEGTAVQLTTKPDPGWSFSHWLFDSVNVGSTSPYIVTMNDDYSLTAVFTENTQDPPVASFIYSPPNPLVNDTITFDASGCSDTDGTIIGYLWDFGDGETSTIQNPTHAYVQAGSYTVTLTVTDDDGLTDTTTATIAGVIIPEFPSWVPTFVTLVIATISLVLYKRKMKQ